MTIAVFGLLRMLVAFKFKTTFACCSPSKPKIQDWIHDTALICRGSDNITLLGRGTLVLMFTKTEDIDTLWEICRIEDQGEAGVENDRMKTTCPFLGSKFGCIGNRAP